MRSSPAADGAGTHICSCSSAYSLLSWPACGFHLVKVGGGAGAGQPVDSVRRDCLFAVLACCRRGGYALLLVLGAVRLASLAQLRYVSAQAVVLCALVRQPHTGPWAGARRSCSLYIVLGAVLLVAQAGEVCHQRLRASGVQSRTHSAARCFFFGADCSSVVDLRLTPEPPFGSRSCSGGGDGGADIVPVARRGGRSARGWGWLHISASRPPSLPRALDQFMPSNSCWGSA